MIPQNKYKYVLTDRFGVLDVFPLDEAGYAISYEKEDDGKYFYVKQFSGKLMFTGEVYQRLKTIERSIYVCTEQNLKIYRKCEQGEILIFDGFFKLTDGSWDDDKCSVELKFQKNTPDKCLKDRKTEKVNLLQEIQNKITVKTSSVGGGVFEYLHFQDHVQISANVPYGGYVWEGTGDPYEQNFQVYSHEEILDTVAPSDPQNPNQSTTGIWDAYTGWVREIVELDCNEPAPSSWVIVENNCVTTGKIKYAKGATLFGCVQNNNMTDANNYTRSYSCNVLGGTNGGGGTSLTATIDNGMLLNDVIKLFVNKFCAGVTVVSDFFQINPQNASSINYVTGAKSLVDNLVLFQKSDVKRPNVSGNAWKAEWTFEKLMETLTIIFNTAYSLENGIFRLEHISFFSRNSGLDLTQQKYEKYLVGFNKYTYDVDTIPQREVFEFKEAYKSIWNTEINYSSTCSIGSNKDNVKNYSIDELTTDVELALNNPDSESSVVEDKGFVLIATRFYNGEYYIITEQTELGTRINNTLSFPQLLRRYHLHNRPVNKGKIGNDTFDFLSVKPVKKGEKITIPLCCDTVFNPLDKVKTKIGIGVVENAVYGFQNETVELSLVYDIFSELQNNEAPTITGANLSTYKNVALVFPINAADSDGVVTQIGIKFQAMSGTVEILSLTEARYTPNTDFEGFDWFSLEVFDNWNESAYANYSVNVLPENQPPVAIDDTFNVYHGQPFTAVPLITQNDSDDFGFTVITTSVVTAQGVAITIAGNGSFSYVPPAGFIGTDSFEYTIEDGSGLQSTASVSLVVKNYNTPVAVDDDYLTKKNTALNVDGTATKPKLFWNDYTPNGQSYSYTTTAEIKATTQGGTVNIAADGTFVYTPATDFVGADSFDYTVQNPNGSDVGTVTINVVPEIFVKLLQVNYGHENIIDMCGQPPAATALGIKNKADYKVRFYSDAGGTTPFDVTGLGFRVFYQQQESGFFGTFNTDFISDVLTGTESVIEYDVYIYEDIANCNSFMGSQNRDVVLLSGAYTII